MDMNKILYMYRNPYLNILFKLYMVKSVKKIKLI